MPLIGVESDNHIKKSKLVEVKNNFVYNSEEVEAVEADEVIREKHNKKENRKRIFKNILSFKWN